jgi:DNA helicase-2/ATP-dependent DNA helicase PcrA
MVKANKKIPSKPISLNDEQQAVVSARSGVFQVQAGPGSGKTFACTQRMAGILKEGVSPDDLLSLSFTSTGAKNLKTKIEEITGALSINRTAGTMTFHGMGLRFAQEERDAFNFKVAEFPLATEPVACKLSAEAARRYEIDPRLLRSQTSLYKRNRISPAEAVKRSEASLKPQELKLALAYKNYDAKMKENGVLDFDSLMYEMVELLEKPDVRKRWQYKYVICDEAQDCCITDWQLLKLITEKHGNLMCVGDPGQSVFGFRGASPDLFLNMEKMFPAVRKLFLAANYRSTPELVSFLKEIGPVPELAEKFHTLNSSGPAPEIKGFGNQQDEINWIVGKIKESI